MEVEKWEGGGQREIKPYAKGNYAAIYPVMLKRLAMRCKFGDMKYKKASGYDHPRPSKTYWDSAVRHLVEYSVGDNSEDHLAAAIWNIMAMMYNEEEAKEFMDFESRKGKNGTYSYFAKKEPVSKCKTQTEI